MDRELSLIHIVSAAFAAFLAAATIALQLAVRPRHLRVVIGVLLGMFALFVLTVLIGAHIGLPAAKVYAFLLLGLAAVSLWRYLALNRLEE